MSAVPSTLAELRAGNRPPAIADMPPVRAGFNDMQGFELAQRGAKLLAASDLVPQAFKGNLANCVVALEMAQRIGASALMVMQNLDIVHGRPTWRAQFVIACVNQCGRFSALRYEWSGTEGNDDWGCRAWAVEKATGEKLRGPLVTIALAKSEGWHSKNGSKWKSIPELMLMYRAGSWFGRTYAPELTMGLQTSEEAHDIIDINADGSYTVTSDHLRSAAAVGPGADGAAVVIDGDTGEIKAGEAKPAADGAPPPLTHAAVAGALEKATTIDALDDAATGIERVVVFEQRKELAAIYKARRAELESRR
ncbi:MAG: hypothetical protein AB7K86_08425 [Rhodospirillales bacterium]